MEFDLSSRQHCKILEVKKQLVVGAGDIQYEFRRIKNSAFHLDAKRFYIQISLTSKDRILAVSTYSYMYDYVCVYIYMDLMFVQGTYDFHRVDTTLIDSSNLPRRQELGRMVFQDFEIGPCSFQCMYSKQYALYAPSGNQT